MARTKRDQSFHRLVFGVAVGIVVSGCSGGSEGGGSVVRPAGGLTYVKSIGVESNHFVVDDSEVLPDDGVVLAGTLGSLSETRLVVTRLDDAGNVRWSRTYGSEPHPDPLALTAMIDAAPAGDGGVFIAGHSRSGMVVAYYDATGQRQRTEVYGNTQTSGTEPLVEIRAIAPAPTGGYVIGGRKLRDVDGSFRSHAWLQYGYPDGAPGPASNDIDGEISDAEGTVTEITNYERIEDLLVYRDPRPTGMLIAVTGTRHEGRLSGTDTGEFGVWVAEYSLDTESPDGDVLPNQPFRPLFTTKMPSGGSGRDGAGAVITRFSDTDTYLVFGAREDGIAQGGRYPFRMHVGGGLYSSGLWKPLSGDVLEDVRESGNQGAYLAAATDELVVGDSYAIFSNNEGRPRYRMEKLRRQEDTLTNSRIALVDLGEAADLTMHYDSSVTLADHQDLGRLSPSSVIQVVGGHFAVGGKASTSRGERPWIAVLDRETRRVRYSRLLEEPGCRFDDGVVSLRTHSDGSLMAVLSSCLIRIDAAAGQPTSVISTLGPPVTTGEARAIEPLPDGGFIVAAYMEGGAWLLRLGESGEIRWQKQLPGVTPRDLERALQTGFDFVLLGASDAGEAVLVSVDGDGIEQWQQRYSDLGANLLERAAGGTPGYFLGDFGSLTRVDGQGNVLWTRESLPQFAAISPTRDGGVALAGFGLTRLDPGGQVVWSSSFVPDVSQDGIHESFGDVFETVDGGFVAAGSVQKAGQDRCYSSAPEPALGGKSPLDLLRAERDPRTLSCSDVWVIAVDRDGNARGARRFGTASHDGIGTIGIGRTSDNGVLIATRTYGFDSPNATAFVLRLSADLTTSAGCPAGLDETILPLAARADAESHPRAELPGAVGATTIPERTSFEDTSITEAMITARSCSGVSTAPRITVTAQGEGLVRSTPAGILCGQEPGRTNTACAQAFAFNTALTLEALPMPDARFEGWDGACSAAGTQAMASLTLRRNVECTARFSSPQANQPPVPRFTRTPSSPVAGAVVTFDATASSDDVGIAEYRWDFEDDGRFDATGDASTHRITQFAYASPGSYVARLAVVDTAGLVAETRQSFSVTTDSAGESTLTLSMVGTGDGSVTYTPAVTACSKSSEPICVRRFATGTSVLLSATPYTGFRIDSWDGCDSVSSDRTRCTVALNAARSVTLVLE